MDTVAGQGVGARQSRRRFLRTSENPAIELASSKCRPYMSAVALLFVSGPFFVSLQASNPVPFPIAEVRPTMHVRMAESR